MIRRYEYRQPGAPTCHNAVTNPGGNYGLNRTCSRASTCSPQGRTPKLPDQMSAQPRILVIEDERELITTVELSLKYNDYRVLQAMDGATGLQLALTERPDLVVLDVQLPE